MAIVGEKLESYVINQINARQRLHGSGAGTANSNSPNLRTDQQINLLNSNTSWVKLASGISVDDKRLVDIGVSTSYRGMGLAKNYILYAGFSRLEQDGTDRLIQRQGFLPQDPNSSYTYGTYGYSPMPGISSADIKALNRGSLKKATVKLTAHNKQQFDIIDLLYLRLGYTVLLEWGNSIYTPDGVTREIVRNTLLENTFFNINGEGSYLDMLGPIEQYRNKYSGNYDGLLGKVSNFSWAFQPDGSYDIEITIISLGDVIESLKTNISAPKNLTEFVKTAAGSIVTSPEEENQPDIIEENKDANAIASMLWVWKWVNRTTVDAGTISSNSITIKLANSATGTEIGSFLKPSGDDVNVFTKKYEFYYVGLLKAGALSILKDSKNVEDLIYYNIPKEYNREIKNLANVKEAKEYQKQLNEKLKINEKNFYNEYQTDGTPLRWDIEARYRNIGNKTTTAGSPIKDFENDDAFWIKTEPVQYYLRFGALLDYVRNDILPKINNSNEYSQKPPIFDIDTDTFSNFMYSLPNQISLDPRVCLVRNSHFTKDSGTADVLPELDAFRAEDYVANDPNLNKAYPFNIYLNFEFIIESLNSNADERGDVNIYNFLKSICDGLNKALGGINNLEPIINESSNTLNIIDTTPIPGIGQNNADYILQLYGYKKAGSLYSSTFVRKVDLKTAITPEYATMVTVGATAGGYVKGVEATAFSRWNIGLTDRFKESFVPGNENSQEENGVDEAVTNYTERFLSPNKFTSCYGFSGNLKESSSKLKLSTDAIENNLSVVTEYFKYLIASNKTTSGGTIGFIPFKISFTMDGISGIKIYNKLHVDTRFLPKAYGDNLNLIVTGVSHKLSNSDWETDIEATVIPRTDGGSGTIITAEAIKEDIQEAKNAPSNNGNPQGSLNSCSGIPKGNGLTASERSTLRSRNIDYLNYKGIQNTDKAVIDFIRGKNEGGYFHPVHAYFYKSENNVQKNPSFHGYGVSGETLWGEDRYAGDGDSTANKREFWGIVDKYSGFGTFSELNLKHGKKWSGWEKWKSPGGNIYQEYKKKGWTYDTLHFPDKTPSWGGRNIDQTKWKKDFERLKELKYKIVEESFYSLLNGEKTGFRSYPELKNLILSDVRTRYMWYRARYNGGGFFQSYATNLKKVWDSGVRDIDRLICADFTYRYNYNKGKTYEPDVKRMADYIIPNR